MWVLVQFQSDLRAATGKWDQGSGAVSEQFQSDLHVQWKAAAIYIELSSRTSVFNIRFQAWISWSHERSFDDDVDVDVDNEGEGLL